MNGDDPGKFLASAVTRGAGPTPPLINMNSSEVL